MPLSSVATYLESGRKYMNFSKIHGAGNDFVMVDTREESSRDWSMVAISVCNRRFGIGADGLILIGGNRHTGFRMTIFNPDGSNAEMCGNGIRCFARFLHERGEIGYGKIPVITDAGSRWIRVDDANLNQYRVTVGMGIPEFSAAKIPVDVSETRVVNHPLSIDDRSLTVTAVSMGNPHAVAFVDDVESFQLESLGPKVEHHALFPHRINFEVCQILGPNTLRMRVWERGAGITLACGSGAAATVAAAILTNRIEAGSIQLHLDGGTLDMEWHGEGNEVIMTGPADRVFEGQWRETQHTGTAT